MKMKFEFVGTRVDATGFSVATEAAAALENVTRIPLQGGKVAVVVKPWETFTSSFNPHGYGVPANRVYSVARFVAVEEKDQHDTGTVLVTYRRQLRAAVKSATFASDAKWAVDEIKRIEPVIFGLGRGFDK